MNLFFFTAADANPVYRREAEILIESGHRHDRSIHFFDIPDGEMWNRYKVWLLDRDDLPAADRYIYLDSDCILTGTGDWESDDCQGVADVLYYCDEPNRHRHTNGFMRNHTVVIGEGRGYEFVHRLWRERQFPIWCNSGVVVLDAEVRRPFCGLWKEWMQRIDAECEKGFMVGDEAALMFARAEFDLPLLPPRFNWMLKWQPVRPDAVLIHADGNVTGPKRQPYIDAVDRLNRETKSEGYHEADHL